MRLVDTELKLLLPMAEVSLVKNPDLIFEVFFFFQMRLIQEMKQLIHKYSCTPDKVDPMFLCGSQNLLGEPCHAKRCNSWDIIIL